jgi:ATP-dependent Clp protease ATP-binding subunit ClpA
MRWFRKQPADTASPPNASSVANGEEVDALERRSDFCCRELTPDFGEQFESLGRETELSELVSVLSCSNVNSLLLVGEDGAGKTSLVKQLARLLAKDKHHPTLDGHSIIEFSFSRASLCSNNLREHFTVFRNALDRLGRGQLLYIPDLFPFLIRWSTPSVGFTFFLEDWKTALEFYGRRRCIVEMTTDQFKAVQSPFVQIARHFQVVSVSSVSPIETIEILNRFRERYEALYKVSYSLDSLTFIVELVAKYSLGALPGSALNLLDRSGAAFAVEMYRNTFEKQSSEQLAQVIQIDNELCGLIDKKLSAVDNQNFMLAAELRESYDKLKSHRWNVILSTSAEHASLTPAIELELIERIARRQADADLCQLG